MNAVIDTNRYDLTVTQLPVRGHCRGHSIDGISGSVSLVQHRPQRHINTSAVSDNMTSPAMRLLTLTLLLPLVTTDYVGQYVEAGGGGGQDAVTQDLADPDYNPMDYIVDTLSALIKAGRNILQ